MKRIASSSVSIRSVALGVPIKGAVCDNPHALRKRIFQLRPVALFILWLALSAPCSRIAAQQTVRRPVALIGIPQEIAPVEARLQRPTVTQIQGVVFTSGSIDGTAVVAARAGAGKVNAAFAATLLVDHFSPSAVIYTGTAGAIDTELNPGDVVIGTAVGYHDFGNLTADGFVRSPTRNVSSGKLDPTFFPADPALLAAARRAARTVKPSTGPDAAVSGVPAHIREGVIITGDAFLANPARRADMRRELNASAVEMEGAAVAQVCARFGVPTIVIRSITDHADGNASDSYRRYIDVAARNAAELALALIREMQAPK
jgi:adenosylhomocysteine nucleosidase